MSLGTAHCRTLSFSITSLLGLSFQTVCTAPGDDDPLHTLCLHSCAQSKEIPMVFRLFALLLVSSLTWGQAANTPPAAVQRMQNLAQQLQLTEPQKEKIMPILVDEAPKVKAVKADTTLSQNDKIVKLLEIRNDSNDKIRPILTPAQQQKLDQMRAQQRQQLLQEMSSSKSAK
jgi:hypothetical protein